MERSGHQREGPDLAGKSELNTEREERLSREISRLKEEGTVMRSALAVERSKVVELTERYKPFVGLPCDEEATSILTSGEGAYYEKDWARELTLCERRRDQAIRDQQKAELQVCVLDNEVHQL